MRNLELAPLLLVTLFLALGFFTMLHQFLCWGVWFQPEDLHHETFVLSCFAMALGVYIGTKMSKRTEKQTEKSS
jgi:uncharacterized membrane protein